MLRRSHCIPGSIEDLNLHGWEDIERSMLKSINQASVRGGDRSSMASKNYNYPSTGLIGAA